MKRKTAFVKKLDFTYWSSPVEDITLHTVSPLTRYDKYFKFQAATNSWATILNGNEIMTAARGYIMRAPDNFSSTVPAQYEVSFVGKPHNGLVETPALASVGTNRWNLIGNPYPSAVSALAFLNDVDNVPAVDGTIYIWTHQTNPTNNGSGIYVYSANDYITFNRTGTVTVSPGNMTTPFNGNIAAGQGFFIKATQNNATAKFKNSMRVTPASTFYRMAGAEGKSESGEMDRLWLDITNVQGGFNQMLVGYMPEATNGFDRGYDGEKLSGAGISLYSMIDNTRYTIQGRAPFAVSDEVVLGYSSTAAATLKISLSSFEGVFNSQDIYLIDHILNVTHNIKNGPYEFASAVGTFNSRFTLVYQASSLGNPDVISADAAVNVVTNTDILVRSTGMALKTVTVYDILGKKLFDSQDNIGGQDFEITSIGRQNQILLVKIKLEDGSQAVRKIQY
ncbi:MAG: T9SS sorting signal type C domain-containing protein [Proteobacteria bacterium]|nr:MAG: T9SS sorting signal type C domain-containing protein [Pseudomonadota bacterium]